MIKWLKSLMGYPGYSEKRDIDKAHFHAIMALAYWEHCNNEKTSRFQLEGTNIYVELGRDDK